MISRDNTLNTVICIFPSGEEIGKLYFSMRKIEARFTREEIVAMRDYLNEWLGEVDTTHNLNKSVIEALKGDGK